MPSPAHGQGDVSAIHSGVARVRQSVLDGKCCTTPLEVAHQQNVSHIKRTNHRRLLLLLDRISPWPRHCIGRSRAIVHANQANGK